MLNKIFSKATMFILLLILPSVLAGFLVKKKLTTVPPGGSCGGLIYPKHKWMQTLGLFPPKCAHGYICDYSNNQPISDAPGICKKVILNEIYSVGGNPLSWNSPTTELYYSEEKLKIIVIGFEDECEKYSPEQSLTGCVNAGEITWHIAAKKEKQKVEFSLSSERHGNVQKKELDYIFDFPDINRFNLKLRVTK